MSAGRVLKRLRSALPKSGICGFHHPDDLAALKALVDSGQAISWLGEGNDAGLVLARLKARPVAAPFGQASRPEGAA